MIHHSAVISKNAEIHETTHIGPFCIIGDGVKIGENNNLISHVSIVGDTTIENSNTFYPFCSIGTPPQDLKYIGEKNSIIIGDNNKFREYAELQQYANILTIQHLPEEHIFDINGLAKSDEKENCYWVSITPS